MRLGWHMQRLMQPEAMLSATLPMYRSLAAQSKYTQAFRCCLFALKLSASGVPRPESPRKAIIVRLDNAGHEADHKAVHLVRPHGIVIRQGSGEAVVYTYAYDDDLA